MMTRVAVSVTSIAVILAAIMVANRSFTPAPPAPTDTPSTVTPNNPQRKVIYALDARDKESGEQILAPGHLWIGNQLNKALESAENEDSLFYVGIKLFFEVPSRYNHYDAVVRLRQHNEDNFIFNGKTLKAIENVAREIKRQYGDAMYGQPLNVTWTEYVGIMREAAEARKAYENETQKILETGIQPLLAEFRDEEIARLTSLGFEFIHHEGNLYALATKEAILSLIPTEDIGYSVWLEIPDLTDKYGAKVSQELAYQLSINESETLNVKLYTVWSNILSGEVISDNAVLKKALSSYTIPEAPGYYPDYIQYDSYEKYQEAVAEHMLAEEDYKEILEKLHRELNGSLLPQINMVMDEFIIRYDVTPEAVWIKYDIQDGRIITEASIGLQLTSEAILALLKSSDVQFADGVYTIYDMPAEE